MKPAIRYVNGAGARRVTVHTNGKQTIRSGHYYQRRNGVGVCMNCKAPKP